MLILMPYKYQYIFLLGAYGFVFVAQDLTSGKEYALKVNILKEAEKPR
jgi:hypothetical protein